MSKGELKLIRWLERSVVTGLESRSDEPTTRVPIHIGDDMGCLTLPGGQSILLSSDMLLDGTHFECETHNLADIAHKAVCCCLSDAAAMAVQPLALLVSLAIPCGTVYETDGPSIAAQVLRLASAQAQSAPAKRTRLVYASAPPPGSTAPGCNPQEVSGVWRDR